MKLFYDTKAIQRNTSMKNEKRAVVMSNKKDENETQKDC